eukprot:1044982-Amorphochlora_amoeboformis.AAC.2
MNPRDYRQDIFSLSLSDSPMPDCKSPTSLLRIAEWGWGLKGLDNWDAVSFGSSLPTRAYLLEGEMDRVCSTPDLSELGVYFPGWDALGGIRMDL